MEYDYINEGLKKNFGTNIYGEPNFRLVFSDAQREIRYGRYDEYYGKIFIRSITGFHSRKKYPMVHERWIIERWYPAEYYKKAQIVLPETTKGDYELIYIFEDKNNNKLPVVEWAAHVACNLSLKPKDFMSRKDELEANEEKIKKDDYHHAYEEVGETQPGALELALQIGEGIQAHYKDDITWNHDKEVSQ